MQRATLELAQRLVIELARDVARHVAHDEPHDLVVDAARRTTRRAPRMRAFDLGRASCRAPRSAAGRRAARDGASGWKRVRAGREVVLDDPLARHARLPLLDAARPTCSRSCTRCEPAVERVRRELAVHVVVAERDVVPPRGAAARRCGISLRRALVRRGERRRACPRPRRAAAARCSVRAGSGSSSGARCRARPAPRAPRGRAPGTSSRCGSRVHDVRRRAARTAAGCSPSRGARRVVIAGDHHDVASGSAARSRENWRTRAGSPGSSAARGGTRRRAISTRSGASSMILSIARVNDCATSASRWLMPRGVSRWYWRKPRCRSERWTRRRGSGAGVGGASVAAR